VSGQAEDGSAEEQPSKEKPDQRSQCFASMVLSAIEVSTLQSMFAFLEHNVTSIIFQHFGFVAMPPKT
jgi:hypothetical protein